jgi:hypothetical protein
MKGMAPSKFRRYQQLNDASRDASEEAAARGAGIDDAPAIVLAPGLPPSIATAYSSMKGAAGSQPASG